MLGPRPIDNRADGGGAWNRAYVHQSTRVEQLVLESALRSAVSAEDYARIVIDIANSAAERKRRGFAQRRRAIVNDAWQELLVADIKNRTTPELWPALMGPEGEYADISRNPARDIWAENAVLYKSAAKRGTPKDFGEGEKYRDLTGRRFHTFWQRVEFDLQAFNDVIIWPTVGMHYDQRVMRHNIAAGDTVTVVFDEELGGSQPYAICFIDHFKTSNGMPTKRYRIWTEDWRLVFNNDGERIDPITGIVIEDGSPGWENPYGILPFVFVHRDPYQPYFWDQTTGEDLISLTLKTGRFETDTDYKAWRAGHKQIMVTANSRVRDFDKTLLDPGALIKIIGDGAVGTLIDWQIDLGARLDTVNGWEIRAAASRGIKPERLRRTNYQNAEVARLSERGLQERRERMEEIFREAESDYYYVTAVVGAEEEMAPRIDKAAELEVIYAPIDYPGEPAARLAVAETQARLGVKSLVDLVLEDHPTWDEDEALEFIEQNIETLAKIQAIKSAASVPERNLANRSADDERAGATGPMIRDAGNGESVTTTGTVEGR
jgi:hypothetical protein